MMKTGSISERTYNNLLQKIMRGEYPAGDRLPSEMELKKQLNVSRNTLRTVLSRMNADGILETRRGSGTYVRSSGINKDFPVDFIPTTLLSSTNLMEIMLLRRSIEVTSAYAAALNATPEEIAEIEKAYRQTNPGKQNDPHMHAINTINFHMKVAYASHNSLTIKLMELIEHMATEQVGDYLEYSGIDDSSFYYHRMILESIRSHMADEAAYMMERHMQGTLLRMRDYAGHYDI